ncbi:hypothetical protein PV325_008149 [Microctonus aethiopoides]|uniref:Uncharacterized protein n=1 Tax=Microctonus aethiopoides TaxID=144406 RepID=A0AA39F6X0_9HYME|nr:hypothetical protein PV325_008149 [Microctonus aethiopoides]KAK0164045.1 hypothetical protein PV328_002715 [Microctonus aethiopoides]
MEDKHFKWDELQNKLIFFSNTEQEDKKTKRRKRKVSVKSLSKIYCPHDYLILKFLDVLNPSQKIKFRKYYRRKVPLDAPDVITIQDIKNLVMFLLITPVSLEFINFFHLRVVDRFLRALIMYFQSYTEIWEEMMKKRVALMTKAPNPLAKNNELMRADQMRILRCVLAREYCGLLVGAEESVKYHHMMAGIQSMLSQGEKDLRIYEVLIAMAHRIVWIALQRKYFHLIEVELHRLFRTDVYNTASRNNDKVINEILLKEEITILHGPKMPSRPKLLMNSPLVYELFREPPCDFRIVSLGNINFKSKDPRINYLKNALLIEEEKLPELGIKLGILGHPRVNYDITLVSMEDHKILKREITEAWERKKSLTPDKPKKSTSIDKEITIFPMSESNTELPSVFPLSKPMHNGKMYNDSNEEMRKKWIARELDRQTGTYSDAMSVATSGDN